MTKKVERANAREERESYSWRDQEVRTVGPVDPNYDPAQAQREREARSTPKPRK